MQAKKHIRGILDKLEIEYHSPQHHNKSNPINELFFILLSLRTDEVVYLDVYRKFKQKYPLWSDVFIADIDEISSVIHSAGLARQKALRLKALLERINSDFSEFSLRKIKSYNDFELENYLLSLPGVGKKSARCVMMFSFNRKVLPVDTHTYRVSARLGLIEAGISFDLAHKQLDEMIGENDRYSFHVNCVSHGRSKCSDKKPRCEICTLRKYCRFSKIVDYSQR
jgi:endonuclease III